MIKFTCPNCDDLLYEVRIQHPDKLVDEGTLTYTRWCKKCEEFFELSATARNKDANK